MTQKPSILVFDSGLGGLTVFRAVAAARPDAHFAYLADDAGFPYGPLPPDVLVSRVMEVVSDAVARFAPDLVVIACNTASTLVLPPLRAKFPDLPFVGTVPAIKPAAATSRSKRITVLATPGTVARDYTRGLIAAHAVDCAVTLVGSPTLAPLAEDFLRDVRIDEDAVAEAIAPCFVECDGARTDAVVLACTHYPLLLDLFRRHAPWSVSWIDPAPAIARRVVSLIGEAPAFALPGLRRAHFTSGAMPDAALCAALGRFGLDCESEHRALCA